MLHKHTDSFADIPGVVESKDVDLRVLAPIEAKASPVAQKRPSTEGQESKTKKTKLDKFDMYVSYSYVVLVPTYFLLMLFVARFKVLQKCNITGIIDSLTLFNSLLFFSPLSIVKYHLLAFTSN